MKRFRLFWLVFPSYVAITLGMLLLVFLEGAARLREFHEESVKASLETDARESGISFLAFGSPSKFP